MLGKNLSLSLSLLVSIVVSIPPGLTIAPAIFLARCFIYDTAGNRSSIFFSRRNFLRLPIHLRSLARRQRSPCAPRFSLPFPPDAQLTPSSGSSLTAQANNLSVSNCKSAVFHVLAERPSPQVEVSSYNFQYTCAVQEWRILTQAPWNPSQCFYKVTTSSLGLNHSSIITLLKNALWFTFVMHFCETFLTSSGILLPWSKSQLRPVMVVVFISYTCRPWPNS